MNKRNLRAFYLEEPDAFENFNANFQAIVPSLDFALSAADEAPRPIFSKAEEKMLMNALSRIDRLFMEYREFADQMDDEGINIDAPRYNPRRKRRR